MTLSFKARVQLFTLLFPVFLAATGLVLHFANQQSLERAHLERLNAYIYNLLAVAEVTDNGLWLPFELADSRFNQVQTGLIAVVRDSSGEVIWSSISALGAELIEHNHQEPLELGLLQSGWTAERQFLRTALPVSFSSAEKAPVYLFEVLQEERLITQESRSFTTTLTFGFIIMAAILMVFIVALMYWLLKPLLRVTEELRQIEKGELEQISETYPKELSLLTRALNTVVSAERKQRERYRHSLGDLAHSLKTPLAVIRGELENLAKGDSSRADAVQQQLTDMNDVVTYQLKRASSDGDRVWAKPVPVKACIRRITEALAKVYKSRGIVVEIDIPAEAGFLGAEADFLEIAGNLIENAFKYSDTTVKVTATAGDQQLELIVADDGPGIPAKQWEIVKQRGVRLDSRPIGQGIGLNVAAEIVASYGGQLALLEQKSGLAGANIRLILPGKKLNGN